MQYVFHCNTHFFVSFSTVTETFKPTDHFISVSAPSPSIIHVFNMQHGAEREKSPEMPADFVCPTCVYLYFLFIFTPTDLNVSVI